MNAESNSCPVYHAPPVTSLAGSSPRSMYTLREPFATDRTLLTSPRASSALSIRATAGCCRFVLARSSLVQMPTFPEASTAW